MTPALTDHLWRRLGLVLRPYGDRMQRVVVDVGDENGPSGAVDKFCRIQVHLIGAPVAAIEHIDTDLYAVVDRSADGVGRVVGRNLGRTQPVRDATRHRSEIQRPAHAHGDIE